MSHEDFQERLKRISAARGTTGATAAGSGGGGWGTAGPGMGGFAAPPPRRRRGLPVLPIVSLVLFLPGALFALHLTASISDEMQGNPDSKGLLERIFPSPEPAWAALPPAPADWMRVTPDDAVPDDVQLAIDNVSTRWPGGEPALRAHPAFQAMGRYLDAEGRPGSMLNPRNPTKEGRAMYLARDGQAVLVELELLPEDKPLGFPDDPESWADALAEHADRYTLPGTAIQRVTMAGLPAVNVYGTRSDNLLETELRPGFSGWVKMDLRVPLNQRARLHIRGVTSPRMAETLIEGVDRAALAARLGGTTE
jgi:hypothetical protein